MPFHCRPGKKFRVLVYVFTILDTIFTPVFLPLITYAFYKDQEARRRETVVQGKGKKKTLRGLYKDQEACMTRDEEIFPLLPDLNFIRERSVTA